MRKISSKKNKGKINCNISLSSTIVQSQYLQPLTHWQYLGFPTAHQGPHEGDIAAGRYVPIGSGRLGVGVFRAGRGLPRQAGLIH